MPFVLKDDGGLIRASPYYSDEVNIHGRRAAALAVDATVAVFAYQVVGAISAGFGVVDLVRQATSP